MRPRLRLLVAQVCVFLFGCGARSGLFVEEGSPPAADAAKPKSDPCAVYSNDPPTCLLHVTTCQLFECGTGPADADVKLTAACVSLYGPIPDICR